jgi:hypothetical protein
VTEPQDDIHRLWRGQPREEHAITIDDIRLRAHRFERKVRRWNIVGAVALGLGFVGDAWQVWRSDVLLVRVGNVLTMAAIVYLAVYLRDYVRTASMPAGLGLTASSEFYRTELARQRDANSHPWRFYAPFIPGMALSLLGGSLDRSPAQNVAMAVLGAGLFLGVAWLGKRTARRLQREIDDLD